MPPDGFDVLADDDLDRYLADGGLAWREGFAEGLRPDPVVNVAEWAAEYRMVAPGTSPYPGRWDPDLVPFLNEIMECLSPDHPAERVVFKKSAQVAGSECGTNWLGSIIDLTPGPAMVVQATVDSGKAWVREKLNPNIEANGRLRNRVMEDKSRSGRGSTGLYKRFPGGFVLITGANSAAALRQHSIRFLFKDDWDEWPQDVDGQGDPDRMANARQIAFHESGLAKRFENSTPTISALSRVTRAYEASDQRRYFVPCPECGHMQVLRFRPTDGKGGLIFNREPPLGAEYACEGCGTLIPHHMKRGMVAKGEWRPQNPGPGRYPGFHINALYSPFTSWDRMAEAFLEAKDNPRTLKTWVNLWEGEAWEERGDAPEWKAIYERRADYPLGVLPPGALVVTAGADVGKDYIRFHVKGWGIGKTSWTIDVGVIEGDTSSEGPWNQLAAVLDSKYEDWQGRFWGIEMAAVDSGYNTHQAYAFCRSRNNAMAIKGMPGHLHPALGVAGKQDVNFGGKRRKNAVQLWPVGTWTLKSEFYGNLKKTGPDGTGAYPPGYCHFSTGLDEDYFRQITAESLVTRERAGREVTEWVATGPNHGLDCEVYALAAAERLGMSLWRVHDWQNLAAAREAPSEEAQLALDALWSQSARRAVGETAPQAMEHDAGRHSHARSPGAPRAASQPDARESAPLVRVRGAAGTRMRGDGNTTTRG